MAKRSPHPSIQSLLHMSSLRNYLLRRIAWRERLLIRYDSICTRLDTSLTSLLSRAPSPFFKTVSRYQLVPLPSHSLLPMAQIRKKKATSKVASAQCSRSRFEFYWCVVKGIHPLKDRSFLSSVLSSVPIPFDSLTHCAIAKHHESISLTLTLTPSFSAL
jgi:hypothetical protein